MAVTATLLPSAARLPSMAAFRIFPLSSSSFICHVASSLTARPLSSLPSLLNPKPSSLLPPPSPSPFPPSPWSSAYCHAMPCGRHARHGHDCGVKRRGMAVAMAMAEGRERGGEERAAVFWDLDNKQPNEAPPAEVALRLRQLALHFADVVDVLAYANRHAFNWVPERVRRERILKKQQEEMERRGLLLPEEPYRCGLCGAYLKTAVKLKAHFKNLHEREQQKKVNHMKQVSPSRRRKLIDKYREKSIRYAEAAKSVLTPKSGYGLMGELRRTGVHVRLVSDAPEAADEALMKDMTAAIRSRQVSAICLISDDKGFSEILRWAKANGVLTLVVGNAFALRKSADLFFSWDDVVSGRAAMVAQSTLDRWRNRRALEDELQDESGSDDEEISFQPPILQRVKISQFAEDEEEGSENNQVEKMGQERFRGDSYSGADLLKQSSEDEDAWWASDKVRPNRTAKEGDFWTSYVEDGDDVADDDDDDDDDDGDDERKDRSRRWGEEGGRGLGRT